MKNIIKEKHQEHYIQGYKFKILSSFDTDEVEVYEQIKQDNEIKEIKPKEKSEPEKIETPIQEPEIKVESVQINPINEEMLKKMEELSSNVVKLQMQLEKQEEEFANRLKSELEIARKNAFEEGSNAAKAESEAKINELKLSVASSIKKLDTKCSELDEFCENTKVSLNEAAYLIAKEVVNKELETSSAKIAKAYANKIMQDLNKSIKVKISVNPNDFDYLQKELSSDKIEILADDGVNKGCLILNSDTLNTQINLKERLAQARSMILDEE